jgi:hypothetical protein
MTGELLRLEQRGRRAVDARTMSARLSSGRQRVEAHVSPSELLRELSAARGGRFGDEESSARRGRAAPVRSAPAVSPAPMISTWRSARSPIASCARSTADRGDARVPELDAVSVRTRLPVASAARKSLFVSGPCPQRERSS